MILEIEKLKIPGAFKIILNEHSDSRGSFVKTFNSKIFTENSLNSEWPESYFSVSKKHVIRGLHYQEKPYDHYKLVSCLRGQVLDVILDLRKNSVMYKQHIAFNISSKNQELIYLPPGIAHGFMAIEENSLTCYKTSSIYSPKHDKGVHWNSIGFDWPVDNPITSVRDSEFISLQDYVGDF
jgi:dTDP-4-dehydrorhamnose 3,5-epimerase